MRPIDEPPKVIRRSIQPRRSKHVDAVVAPAEAAGKISQRHHFDKRDACLRKIRQLVARGRPRSLWGERADMQLVNHLTLAVHSLPRRIGPLELARINNDRRSMRALRLIPRGRVGKETRLSLKPEPISRARLRPGHDTREVPVFL